MAKLPILPKNPERVCWGCDKFCPADSLACGNGTIRTQHPVELFGEDWLEWSVDHRDEPEPPPLTSRTAEGARATRDGI